MTVLVTAASKHGATAEIAQAIVRGLQRRGVTAAYLPLEDVRSLHGYTAVVLGGAVYTDHWPNRAVGFVESHAQALRALPVWLFSSGPVGDAPAPEQDPVDVARLLNLTEAREHRLFAGSLNRSSLRAYERAVAHIVGVSYGDYRDWDAIDAWAGEIAEALGAC